MKNLIVLLIGASTLFSCSMNKKFGCPMDIVQNSIPFTGTKNIDNLQVVKVSISWNDTTYHVPKWTEIPKNKRVVPKVIQTNDKGCY